MHTLSRFVLRHKLLVLLAWLVVLGVGVATVGQTTERLSARFTLPGADGYETNVAIEERFGNGGGAHPIVPVATLPAGLTADQPEVTRALAEATGALARQGLRAATYPSVSDARVVFGLVHTPGIPQSAPNAGARRAELAEAVRVAFRAALPAGTEVELTGLDQLSAQSDEAEDGSAVTLTETVTGAVGALVVLAFVFGSLLALLPLLVAAVSILSGFLVVLAMTYVVDVADLVQYLLAFVGLGVAIDYALLFVTRWREERQAGHDDVEALHRTMDTAGRAIVVSGATVAIGMVVLAVLPSPALRSLALGVVLVPVFSVLVTLTLLPALLGAAGPRLDWPRLRVERTAGGLWRRWATVVVRWKWLSLLAALAVLLPLGLVSLTLQVGEPSAAALAAGGEPAAGLERLSASGVPSGVLTPIEVMVPVAEDPAAVADRLAAVEGVHTAAAPAGAAWTADGQAVVTVLPADETSTEQGRATVARVRETVGAEIPSARVGGSGAALIDEIDAEYGRFPLLLGLITVVAFVVLTRAFRSVVLGLQAVVLNLLSIGAAYGVLVLVWQEGYGSQLLWGIPGLGAVSTLVPLLTFAFLFGLSMDYEVFLMSRMREEYDATGSTTEAIITGLGRIGRLVTCAALILFLAFASLAGLPEVQAKVMATGLGAGILVDATILRMLLLPAVVAITGRHTWWLPAWLSRLWGVRRERTPGDLPR